MILQLSYLYIKVFSQKQSFKYVFINLRCKKRYFRVLTGLKKNRKSTSGEIPSSDTRPNSQQPDASNMPAAHPEQIRQGNSDPRKNDCINKKNFEILKF